MSQIAVPLAVVSLVLAALLTGFFYAWVVSTMWGLDAAPPRVAIRAMQEMNASVRNAAFFPVFFLTGPAFLATALVVWRARLPGAMAFAVAGIVILVGGVALTMAVNVPMNEALAEIEVPADGEAARATWQDFSGRWQVWNQIRTAASGAGFLFGLWGFAALVRA